MNWFKCCCYKCCCDKALILQSLSVLNGINIWTAFPKGLEGLQPLVQTQIVHVDKHHIIRHCTSTRAFISSAWGSVQMFLAQLSGRKENRSVLRLWLSRGAYLLTVNQSSWVCIASTFEAWEVLILPYFCVRVHMWMSAFASMRAHNCACEVKRVRPAMWKRASLLHTLPALPHIWHSLALYGRSAIVGAPEENNNHSSQSLLRATALFSTVVKEANHVTLSLHIRSYSWKSTLTSAPWDHVKPFEMSHTLSLR